mgnify:CR=1 FL=1
MGDLDDLGLPTLQVDLEQVGVTDALERGRRSLWAAALLTLVTGWVYLRIGLRHMD